MKKTHSLFDKIEALIFRLPLKACQMSKECKTRDSPLRKEVKEDLYKYFESSKPYLNPKLSLADVACTLKVNPTYLSRLINNELDMHFYSFVNQYRIGYALSLIRQSDYKIKVSTLYTTAGFKSRSVFYKQFQEKTGCTPKEYIRKNSLHKIHEDEKEGI